MASSDPLVSEVGGATASAASLAACYPLYTITVRMQAQRKRRRIVSEETDEVRAGRFAQPLPARLAAQLMRSARAAQRIWEAEGVLGFYPGLRGAMLATTLQSAVFYYWLHIFAALQHPRAPTPLLQMKAAAQAGTVAVLTTTPLWVVNTRMITSGESRIGSDARRGWTTTFADVVRDEGLRGLWAGVGPSLLLVANPAVQMGAEELLRGVWWRVSRHRDLSDYALLCIGAAAKAIATIATYPMQTIRTNLACDGLYRSTWGCLMRLVAEGRLFSGIWPKLLQSATTAAVASLIRERVIGMLLLWLRGKKPVAE